MSLSLLVLSGNKQGMSIPLGSGHFIIGSGRRTHLRSHRPGIGKYHCALSEKNGQLLVQDLNSGQPTFANGSPLPPGGKVHLSVGQRLRVGPLEFLVLAQVRQTRTILALPLGAPSVASATGPGAPLAARRSAVPVAAPAPGPVPVYDSPMAVVDPDFSVNTSTWLKLLGLGTLAAVCMTLGWFLFHGLSSTSKTPRVAQTTPPDVPAPTMPSPPVPPTRPSKPATPASTQPGTKLTFAEHVRPIFVKKCINCHNALKPQGKTDLTSLEGVLRSGKKNDPIVIAGKPDRSSLWLRIEDGSMPPPNKGTPLTAEEKKVVFDWIKNAGEKLSLAPHPLPEPLVLLARLDRPFHPADDRRQNPVP
jgi:hypothetical protein